MRDNTIAGLCRVLSRDSGMSVTVGGDTSFIDHDGNINIAVMEDSSKGRMLSTGLVYHEYGHKKYSDLKVKPAGLLGTIANIIEDIRSEYETNKERPGTTYQLGQVTVHYHEKKVFEPKTINQAIAGKVMALGRGKFLGQPRIQEIIPSCDELMEDAFSDEFVSDLEQLIDFKSLKTTQDSIDMAQRIINLVIQEDEKKKQAPSSTSQSKSPSQQSSKNGGSAKAQPSRGSQNENEGESGLDEENGSSGGDIDDGATESSVASQGQDDNTSSSSSATAKGAGGSSVIDINKMLQEEDDYGDIGVLMMNETSDDACDSYKIPQLPKYEKKKINNPKLDEVKAISASSRMRAKMYGMLQATKRQPVHFGTTGKKIKAKRLVGMSVGDPRIFSKKIETKAMNTAVVICVDYSGSMSGATKVSNPAAFAVHHALFGLPGTAVATMSFGTITCEGKDSFLVLVGFGEKPISSQFNLPAQGGTPTTEVIWGARALLLERPEKRKIIMVVTDGSPNSTTTAKEAIKRTEQDGIQVCAIGIDTQCVKHLFKKSACIKNINELPDKMFIILDELMFD